MVRALCLAVCMGGAFAGPANADMVDADQPFQLTPGQHVNWTGGRLRLAFDRVVQDSRCPRGEQCLVAGTATVRFVVEGAEGVSRTLELRLPDRTLSVLAAAGPHLQLVRLDPYPVSGRPTPPERYQVTAVIRSTGVDAER